MKYQFLNVTNKELLEKVYRFRYEVMHHELEIIDKNKEEIERDIYDDYSDQFVILNCEGDICCTMRLIHNSPVGYPTEDFLDLNKPEYQFDRSKLAEMSRIFIDPRYRNMRETRIFISNMVKSLAYEKIKEYGIEYCYGSMEPKFIKLVNMFKIPYHPIGKVAYYAKRMRCPSMLYVKDLEKENPQIEKGWDLDKKVSIFNLGTKIKPEQVIL